MGWVGKGLPLLQREHPTSLTWLGLDFKKTLGFDGWVLWTGMVDEPEALSLNAAVLLGVLRSVTEGFEWCPCSSLPHPETVVGKLHI